MEDGSFLLIGTVSSSLSGVNREACAIRMNSAGSIEWAY